MTAPILFPAAAAAAPPPPPPPPPLLHAAAAAAPPPSPQLLVLLLLPPPRSRARQTRDASGSNPNRVEPADACDHREQEATRTSSVRKHVHPRPRSGDGPHACAVFEADAEEGGVVGAFRIVEHVRTEKLLLFRLSHLSQDVDTDCDSLDLRGLHADLHLHSDLATFEHTDIEIRSSDLLVAVRKRNYDVDAIFRASRIAKRNLPAPSRIPRFDKVRERFDASTVSFCQPGRRVFLLDLQPLHLGIVGWVCPPPVSVRARSRGVEASPRTRALNLNSQQSGVGLNHWDLAVRFHLRTLEVANERVGSVPSKRSPVNERENNVPFRRVHCSISDVLFRLERVCFEEKRLPTPLRLLPYDTTIQKLPFLQKLSGHRLPFNVKLPLTISLSGCDRGERIVAPRFDWNLRRLPHCDDDSRLLMMMRV
mmetsp:Transcript_28625/g.68282  ORF Transcript_28625/g.68282 Transcript_28625/m.68282 type:complete len:423 (-) Transcript_28625:15-1283(-)